MIKAKVSTDYKDIERIFAGGSIQKEILKVWSTDAGTYVFEAWKILEMEGPLPITFKANGEPIIDYRIYGNTEQTGTPTPENPIMPIGCGERTENLFSSMWEQGFIDTVTGQNMSSPRIIRTKDYILIKPNVVYSFRRDIVNGYINVRLYGADKTYIGAGSKSNIRLVSGTTVGTPMAENVPFCCFEIIDSEASYIRFNDLSNNTATKWLMVEGEYTRTTMPEYEPYGYKLPILSNSTVTNIYLGEVETTRRIKKLVLTGKENWAKRTYGNPKHTFEYAMIFRIIKGLCSHYANYTAAYIDRVDGVYLSNTTTIIITDLRFTAVTDFRDYLAAQYAAGTPVTVWYVLAEPETAIVNEPLMKIGDYADTIDNTQANVQIPTYKGTTTIDYDGEDHFITSDGYELVDKNQNGFLLSGSTLRPSKMYIKYKGR